VTQLDATLDACPINRFGSSIDLTGVADVAMVG
jgi:hypothetical protein